MTVAVTGASGHVGANLVRALLSEGRRVRALVRRDTAALEGLDVTRVQGELLKGETLRELVEGAEVVYHLAAVITLRSRKDAYARRVNVEGTRNVVEACLACGVKRLVHFSSIHAFSASPLDRVIDESRPLCSERRPLPYDQSKADGEGVVQEAVRERGLNAVIVNPTAVLGPHDYKPSAMGQVLIDLARRKLPALVDGGFNWVDVRDVCAGAMVAERSAAAGEKYLLGGHHLSLRGLAAIVEDVTGVRPPATIPIWLAYAGVPFAAIQSWITGKLPRFSVASLAALRRHQQVSHEKAARELGYRPRPIRETIEDAYAWFRDRGVLTT